MSTEKIMEQAQVFASAWSVVGGPFDGGDAMEVATQEKAELKRMVAELAAERDTLAAKLAELEWISIADAMPNTQQQVDIAYIDANGKPQTTMGWYCRARTLESANFAGEVDDEYDEETYTYYMKEQWVDESHEAEYHYSITGVTHWKPRAKHPDSKH